MKANLWPKVSAALDQLLALPPEQRETLLDRLRAEDAEICAEVEALLSQQPATDILELEAGFQKVLDQLKSDNTGNHSGNNDSTCDLTPNPPPFSEPPSLPEIPGYEILSELGRGGMGVVYKARHLKLNRIVALKMILAGNYAGEKDIARFLSEAEAVAAFRHPNIVQVFDLGQHGQLPYMALEFIEGGSLADVLEKGPLPPKEAAHLVEQIAQGMNAVHQVGIVHRDLKPANVLLGEQNTPKITDFGIAKRVDGGASLTQTGTVLGTASYMAPEQAVGNKKCIASATDVYALGAILYECLTGRPPFKSESTMDTLWQVINKDPVQPRQLNGGVPKDLEIICLKCLEKEPHKRYASAKALADDLRRWQEGQPIAAWPAGRIERAVKRMKRQPMASALVAAVMLLTVTLGFGRIILNWSAAPNPHAMASVENDHVKKDLPENDSPILDKAHGNSIGDRKSKSGSHSLRDPKQIDPEVPVPKSDIKETLPQDMSPGDNKRPDKQKQESQTPNKPRDARSTATLEPSLNIALVKIAPELMKVIKGKGYKNVGVLKFMVARSDQTQPSFNVGTFNQLMANRLEVALVLENHVSNPIGIIRNASAVAAQTKNADVMTPKGREALFQPHYPLAWGKEKVKADVFLTGMVGISKDRRILEIYFYLVDKKELQPALRKVVIVANDPALLAEMGESFQASFNEQPTPANPDNPKISFVQEEVEEKRTESVFSSVQKVDESKEDHPLALPDPPIKLAILQNGQRINIEFDDKGRAFINPANLKENQPIRFQLTRDNTNVRYGIVLKVNGINTLGMQSRPDLQSRMWIMDPKTKSITLDGFQVTDTERIPFMLVSPKGAEQRNTLFTKDTGMITITVFQERQVAKEVVKYLEPSLEASKAEAVNQAQLPEETPATFEALNAKLLSAGNRSRKLIMEAAGQRLPSGFRRVTFVPEDVPITSASIRYFENATK